MGNALDSIEPIEYPRHTPIEKKPAKSKKDIAALIAVIVVVSLLVLTLILPWYCIHVNLAMVFIVPISASMDMDFHISSLHGEIDTPMGEDDVSESISYAEIEQKASDQGKEVPSHFINLFFITLILIIITFIMAILTFIGVISNVFSFGNKKNMKKIAIICGILTFIFAISTAGYFMVQWDSSILNDVPSLDDDESDGYTETTQMNLFDTTQSDQFEEIAFWDHIEPEYNIPATQDENSSFEFFDLSALNLDLDMTFSPGLAWYLIIFSGIAGLFSSIILIDKKTKQTMILLLVCTLVLTGGFYYLSLNAKSDGIDSSGSGWDSMFDTDPVEEAKFMGEWHLDMDNSVLNNSGWSNISSETWIFTENSSGTNLDLTTEYESGASGSSWGTFYAANGKLTAGFDTNTYVFSDYQNQVTLTNSNDEIRILIKQ